MKTAKVSIIIPIYNVEKYLRRCLDSVKNQTFQDWQAILIDDGATDKSGVIADEYAAHDKRFVVVHKENGGSSDARNTGIKKASGEYILLLDSDDFIHPQTIEILYSAAKQNDADMVVFDYDKVAQKQMKNLLDDGIDISKFIPNSYYKKYDKVKTVVTDNILFHSTERNHTLKKYNVRKCYPVLKMLRREIIQKHPFIKGIIIEDFPWWSEIMLMRPRTVIVKSPLYFYVPNMTSILHGSKIKFMIESICTGLEHVYKLYSVIGTDKERKHYYREFLWPFIITVMRLMRGVNDAQSVYDLRKRIMRLYNLGVFKNPPTLRARKYKSRIEKFISVN